MTDFFHGIAYLFENYLFWPYDALKHLQESSWFLANIFSWIFLLIGVVAFVYWMLKLKEFGEHDDHVHEYDHHLNAQVTPHTVEH